MMYYINQSIFIIQPHKKTHLQQENSMNISVHGVMKLDTPAILNNNSDKIDVLFIRHFIVSMKHYSFSFFASY